jgi:cell division protein FtsB
LDNSGTQRRRQILIAVIVLNAFVTAYLAKTVWDQEKRIQTLERNDKINQSVDKLNNEVDSLKERVKGLFK